MSTPTASAQSPQTVAAVDLGSNSFHMIVGQLDNGQLQIIDRLREPVRLGAGLDEKKRLRPDARERALECLSRFGQRLRTLPPGAVRIVGTNTLRQLKDDSDFLAEAEEALGHPIEVIAGREEARLVYLGVAHGLAAGKERRLVVDIGGGSTELILGKGMVPLERESLFMGCVSMSRRFFPDGRISEDAMDQAVMAGRLELRPIKRWFRDYEWERAVGSSGTIRAIRKVVQAAGWSEEGITRSALKKLRRELVVAKHIDKVELEGISDDRRPVFAGGVAVLSAVFKTLDVEHMGVSDLALREGLLYELLGHIQHQDVRDRTVEAMRKRYQIDEAQAVRVRDTAQQLLLHVAGPWELIDEEDADMLTWASDLHEIGLGISHGAFHKHGAYILENSDLPGFSRQQQAMLAAMVRGHRRKFPEATFEELSSQKREDARRLTVLLRLAVLLHRGRSNVAKPQPRLSASGHSLNLTFPDNWLSQHPLTQAELQAEAEYLQAAGFKLNYA